jgi:hypothetical protein
MEIIIQDGIKKKWSKEKIKELTSTEKGALVIGPGYGCCSGFIA